MNGSRRPLDLEARSEVAWLQSEQSLLGHPKTKRAAKALGISIPTMIGHLHCLWYWALDYAKDGVLEGYELWEIAEAALWEGDPDTFVAALRDCGRDDDPGFLEVDEVGLCIHDWYDYAGKLIEKRVADAERKRVERDVKKPSDAPSGDVRGTSNGCPTDVAGRVPNQPNQPKNTGGADAPGEPVDNSPATPRPPSRTALIRGRFDHWRETFPEKTAKMTLTKDRQRAIGARLAEGIAPEVIDQAVTNAHDAPWWNGAQDGEWKADIKTICGKGSTVERLAANVRQAKPVGSPSNPRPLFVAPPDPTPEERAASRAAAKAAADRVLGRKGEPDALGDLMGEMVPGAGEEPQPESPP